MRFGFVGASDIVGWYYGRFVAIEVKIGDNQPSKEQVEFIDAVNRDGGFGAIVWNLNAVKLIYEAWKKDAEMGEGKSRN